MWGILLLDAHLKFFSQIFDKNYAGKNFFAVLVWVHVCVIEYVCVFVYVWVYVCVLSDRERE